jgi:hypothetical protein
MTITISAMGQEQTVKISSTSDYYYANDIRGVINPFASLSGGDMAAMFGSSSKEFADKMKAMQAKLPNATPLRASSASTMISQGQTRMGGCESEGVRDSFHVYTGNASRHGRSPRCSGRRDTAPVVEGDTQ